MGIDDPLRPAVFLDRDGIVNRAVVRDGRPYPPADAGQVEVPSEVPVVLRRLKAAGYLLIVVTNQPDVARGTQSTHAVHAIHARLAGELPIDDFRTCFHDDVDDCTCRKPKPGLIVDAAATFGIDLAASVMVGDRWRDIEAGRRAGCRTVFVDRGYLEQAPERPDAVVTSLDAAAAWILSTRPIGGR